MKKLIHSFTARKILELLLTLLIVTFLSFLLVKLSPVDAAEAYARRTFMLYTPEQLDELREEMGLNQPLLVQYGTWVGNALHLDFGTSLVNGRSVLGEVSRAMGVTLSIVLIAAVIEAVGILLVGSLCYWCRRKWAHLLLVFVCIVGVSIPPFFLASSFLDVFAVRFGWISVASSTGLMRYLPAAICLAVGGIALYSQLLSKNIEREMKGLCSVRPLPGAFRHEDFVDPCTAPCAGRSGAQFFADGWYLSGRLRYCGENLFPARPWVFHRGQRTLPGHAYDTCHDPVSGLLSGDLQRGFRHSAADIPARPC